VLYSLKEILAERAKFSLSKVNIATHHGCHYTKVFYDEVTGGLWEYPTLLDEICAAFSATLVDYSERSSCCGLGFSHLIDVDEYTEATSFRKLESVLAEEPDLIVTMCAGCQLILDRFQRQFEERLNRVRTCVKRLTTRSIVTRSRQVKRRMPSIFDDRYSPLLKRWRPFEVSKSESSYVDAMEHLKRNRY